MDLQHPEDVRAAETVAYVTAHLPTAPARVLDVGCGDGRITAALQAAGHTVTGIDPDADAVREATARGVAAHAVSLLDYRGGPFDAVLFCHSLHHVHPLAPSVTALLPLLAPDGRVIVEELAFERVDDPTAAWFLGTQDVLIAAGVLSEGEYIECSDVLEGDGPLARWRDARERHHRAHDEARRAAHGNADGHEHAHHHGHAPGEEHREEHAHLHDSGAMRAELGAHLHLLHTEDAPALWAFWTDGLAEGHTETARRLMYLERALIEQQAIRPLGVRWVFARR